MNYRWFYPTANFKLLTLNLFSDVCDSLRCWLMQNNLARMNPASASQEKAVKVICEQIQLLSSQLPATCPDSKLKPRLNLSDFNFLPSPEAQALFYNGAPTAMLFVSSLLCLFHLFLPFSGGGRILFGGKEGQNSVPASTTEAWMTSQLKTGIPFH